MLVGQASTPNESDEDDHQYIRDSDEVQFEPEDNEPEDNDSPLSQHQNDNNRPQIGRQKAVAAVSNVHTPEMIAKLTCALKKSNVRVIEDVRSHYAVSAGEQPEGIVSDELRAGTKRAAATISRSQFEIYSFASRHAHDQEGNRIFEKANSGLVLESFYLLDTESAPLITIVASVALHQGNLIQHLLYCK